MPSQAQSSFHLAPKAHRYREIGTISRKYPASDESHLCDPGYQLKMDGHPSMKGARHDKSSLTA